MKIPSNLLMLGAIAALIIGGAFAVTLALARAPMQAASTGTPGTTGTVIATGTGTVQAKATPVPPILVRVWNSMCVEGVPYTLLSVPLDAKFALVTPLGQPHPVVPVTGGTSAPSGTAAAGVTAVPSGTAFVGGTAAPAGTGTPQANSGTALVPVTGNNSSSNKGTLGMIPSDVSCTGLGTVSGLQLIMCTGPEAHAYTLYAHDTNGTQVFQGTLWDCAKGNTAPAVMPTSTTMPTLQPVPSGTAPVSTLPATLPPTLPPTTPAPPTPTP